MFLVFFDLPSWMGLYICMTNGERLDVLRPAITTRMTYHIIYIPCIPRFKKVSYIEFQCQNIYQGTQAYVMIKAILYGQKRLFLDMTTKNALTPSNLLQMTQNLVCSFVGA